MQIKNRVLDLKTCDADTFLSWEFNTLKEKDRDVSKLKKAILKGGFSFPVIVWQKFVIDGAGHRKAVEELVHEGHELKEIQYVEIEAENLEDAKQKALEVSSSYGDVTRASFLEFTKGMDLDFGTFDIDGISEDIMLEDEDKDDIVPSVPKEPRSKIGDLYILGNHRLLCGDSTSAKDVETLMDGAKADMIFTDPPYNVDYKGSGKNTKNGILNDKMDDDKFLAFLSDTFLQMKGNIKENAGCYVFHSHKTATAFETALKANNFDIHTQLIWNKPSAGLGMNDFRTKHEPFYYCSLKDPIFYGDRTHTSVWDLHGTEEELIKWAKKELKAQQEGKTSIWTMKRDSVAGYVHPTQKPVELITYALKNSSKQDDIVVDLFGGSGSTLIACEKAQRTCYTMELDQKFVDVIVTRYCQYVESNKVILNGEEIDWETK